MAKIVLIFGAIFVLPFVFIIGFIRMRSNAHRKKRAIPWTAVATKFGGVFNGDSIVCTREGFELRIDVVSVSVIQASAGPYYYDGGTFTKASLRSQAHIAAVQAPTGVAMTNIVPGKTCPGTFVLEPQGAAVVMHGNIVEAEPLESALLYLAKAQEIATTQGPLQVTKDGQGATRAML